MVNSELYTTIPKDQDTLIKGWDQLINYYKELPIATDGRNKKWIYRGQKTYSEFDFTTSLERAAKSFAVDHRNLADYESWLLREFKRRLHHYATDIPKNEDTLEWLALMQHYGAPTRLLDWTYSFFVATFFAVEGANEHVGCEVWALNADYFGADYIIPPEDFTAIQDKVERLKQDPTRRYEDKPIVKQDVIIDYLWENPVRLVHTANPFRLNDRLTVQQGVFLFPGDVSKSFEDNLSAPTYSLASKHNLIRFKIDSNTAVRREILENLYRMNINRATLFPGLEGFAASLRTRLAFLPEIAT